MRRNRDAEALREGGRTAGVIAVVMRQQHELDAECFDDGVEDGLLIAVRATGIDHGDRTDIWPDQVDVGVCGRRECRRAQRKHANPRRYLQDCRWRVIHAYRDGGAHLFIH
jgi:hypothetical protein